MRNELVISSFNGSEHPCKGLIIRTDRGSHCTSKDFQSLLVACGFPRSMRRKGSPYDNAVMEPFYKTLKRELFKGANCNSPEQAHMVMFKYIALFYITKKMQPTLGYVSPVQFEIENC